MMIFSLLKPRPIYNHIGQYMATAHTPVEVFLLFSFFFFSFCIRLPHFCGTSLSRGSPACLPEFGPPWEWPLGLFDLSQPPF